MEENDITFEEVVPIINDLFEKAEQGDSHAMRIIGEIFCEHTHQMIASQHCSQFHPKHTFYRTDLNYDK